jgi:alpha(1,3/1,4) fucosyltransferase
VSSGIYIDPPAERLLDDRLFAAAGGVAHSSLTRCLGFVRDSLAAQGIPLHTADKLPPPADAVRHLYLSIGNHARHEQMARRPDLVLGAFFVTEAPVVEPSIYAGLPAASRRFRRIYSCISDESEVAEFAGERVKCLPLRWPIDFRGVDRPLWERSDRRFVVMINMNKLPKVDRYELFRERMRAVEHFARTGDIDLYGVGWRKASMRLGKSSLPWIVQRLGITLRNLRDRIAPDPLLVAARKVYKGELDTKWETLSCYDFVLCFENTARQGWLTEKLFEALRVGTIPVYWGASDIAQLVPPDCFVDMREFDGYGALLKYLKSLDAAAVRRYREAGRAFLESPRFTPFGREAFHDIFRLMLAEDLGIRVPPAA